MIGILDELYDRLSFVRINSVKNTFKAVKDTA